MRVYTCHCVRMEVSSVDSQGDSLLCFCCVAPRAQTRVIRLGSERLCLLAHLIGSGLPRFDLLGLILLLLPPKCWDYGCVLSCPI